MSHTPFEAADKTTEQRLLHMQENLLPLLRVVTRPGGNRPDHSMEIFDFSAQMAERVGRLSVSYYADRFQVKILEDQDDAHKSEYPGVDEPPIDFRTSYRVTEDRKINPDSLYPRGLSVSFRDYGKRASGLYHPYLWPDGGTSLQFDLFGSMSDEGLDRVQDTVAYMTACATDFVVNEYVKIPA